MNLIKNIFLFLVLLSVTGCGFKWDFWNSDEDPEALEATKQESEATSSDSEKGTSPMNKGKITIASPEQLSLMNAKLWIRVDQLEREIVRHKEMIEVLKKGLVLGILPEDLRVEYDILEEGSEIKKDQEALSKKVEKGSPMIKVASPSEKGKAPSASVTTKSEKTGPLDSEEQKKYQSLLIKAQDQYRSGRYGKAITLYQELEKTYEGRTTDGTHMYWLAASWASLKEYVTSQEYYAEFLKKFPESPWAPRAKLDVARLDYQAGYRTRALTRLKSIIKDHPYEDASEMARMEIEKMRQQL